jgi:hypothetical protein
MRRNTTIALGALLALILAASVVQFALLAR